ncbi:MAG: hypothetical protein Q9183_004888 [Haloplaca sp. 2 TL-2023]
MGSSGTTHNGSKKSDNGSNKSDNGSKKSDNGSKKSDNGSKKSALSKQRQELMNSSLYRLPAEILINVVDRIDLVSFPNMMIALFHLLRKHGMIPSYPSSMIHDVVLRHDPKDPNAICLGTMPKELLLAIGQNLTTTEKVHMTLATHRYTDDEVFLITHMKAGASKLPVQKSAKNKS